MNEIVKNRTTELFEEICGALESLPVTPTAIIYVNIYHNLQALYMSADCEYKHIHDMAKTLKKAIMEDEEQN